MPITAHTDLLDGQLGYPGGLVTTVGTTNAVIRTGVNAESSTIIPFGFGVCKGTNDGDLILPVDGNSVFMGVATIMQIEKRDSYSLDSSDRFGCPIDHELAYVEVGEIWVYVDDSVVEGDAVYLNHTASTSVVGAFRNDSNSSNAVLIAGARFLKTVAGGTSTTMKIAPIRLNRP